MTYQGLGLVRLSLIINCLALTPSLESITILVTLLVPHKPGVCCDWVVAAYMRLEEVLSRALTAVVSSLRVCECSALISAAASQISAATCLASVMTLSSWSVVSTMFSVILHTVTLASFL